MSREPTNGELKIMLENIHEKLEDVKKTGIDTNAKATYTNGRVTKLEDAVAAFSKIIANHEEYLMGKDGLVAQKNRFWGIKQVLGYIVAPAIIILGWLFNLYIDNLKTEMYSYIDSKNESIK